MLTDSLNMDELNPGYQLEIQKFALDFDALPESDFHGKRKLLLEFASKFFMIPQLWKLYYSLLDQQFHEEDAKSPAYGVAALFREYSEIEVKAKFYYVFNESRQTLVHSYWYSPRKNAYWKPYEVSKILSDLSCPQKRLHDALRFYQEFSCKPLPKEAYDAFTKAQKIYESLLEVDNNSVEWFMLLSQADNVQYVIRNVEFRLGNEIKNQQLWKFYIQYLKNHDQKELLHVYSRYCRLFINDFEMKTEYENAVQRYGPIEVYWKNPFCFETQIEEKEFQYGSSAEEESEPAFTLMKEADKASFQNFTSQNFSFPKSTIKYILAHKTSDILHKLHQSCKFFFVEIPHPVCHNLWVWGTSSHSTRCVFIEQSVVLEVKIPTKTKTISQWVRKEIVAILPLIQSCKKILESKILRRHTSGIPVQNKSIFNHSLIISNAIKIGSSVEDNIMKTIAPNIFECNIKFLRIWSRTITFEELKFLVGKGNIEVLSLDNVEIVDGEKKNVMLDQILQLVPKIVDFYWSPAKTDSQTFDRISKMHFVNKFKRFKLHYIDFIDPHGLCEFAKKNFDSETYFSGTSKTVLGEGVAATFKTVIENELKNYWPDKQKPLFSLSLEIKTKCTSIEF